MHFSCGAGDAPSLARIINNVRQTMKTVAIIGYFLMLAFFSAVGPVGFDDKLAFVLLPFCVIACAVVVSKRFPRLNAHILWAAFCAVSLTQMYRAYAYQKWSAGELDRMLHERMPNHVPDPTPASVTPAAEPPARHP